ncbi:MFS transporter [Actinoplanes sp. NPDC020271]|uniref:MFS transporter n=1 Tax=Actinoplanes sp. NPDC020271 TaxID=3363896 RepID=UPI0037AC40DC
MTISTSHRPMTRGLTVLFAVAAGLAVGNLYWAQPLLGFIAGDLRTGAGAAGWLVTATQLGYAVGVLLIVPLGDVLDRRRLIPVMLLCSAVALAGCALAPTFPVLLAAMAALGATTVAGQLLTPLAGDLAGDGERGRVLGVVVSGVLTGVLVSRTVSGLVSDVAGWRVVFGGAAVAAVVFAAILRRAIPVLPPREPVGYPALIRSVGTVVARERAARWTLALGGTGFAAFTMFWTALTFLLSAEPFGYSTTVIGLFGLAGLAGAIAAQRVGRLHDRGWSVPAVGVAGLLLTGAYVLAGLGGHSVVLILVAVVLLDVAVQALNVLNQVRMFAVAPAARSRLNTAFVTGNFVGGAIGSAAATLLWSAGGWTAVTATGAALGAATFLIWLAGRRGPLRVTNR